MAIQRSILAPREYAAVSKQRLFCSNASIKGTLHYSQLVPRARTVFVDCPIFCTSKLSVARSIRAKSPSHSIRFASHDLMNEWRWKMRDTGRFPRTYSMHLLDAD